MSDPDAVLAYLDSVPRDDRDPWSNVVPFSAWDKAAPQEPRSIQATPFVWRAEADVPPRKWLYGKHLLRKYVSLDVAAGGIGKSSVKIGEALAMATGRELYGKRLPEGALAVWLYNLEDPVEETERRILATAKRFAIKPDDVGERLYVDSGRERPVILAEDTGSGVKIARPVVDALIAELTERGIDVLVVDPFVSSHRVNENDNGAIDMVAKQWAAIADQCDCAINLVHHIRKANGQEAGADHVRGASALIGAARSVMVYNRMTADEADRAGLGKDQAGFYFRIQNEKANLAPAEAADWYRMNNVDLANGDQVGVACSWRWPDTFEGVTVDKTRAVQRAVAEGEWRQDSRSGAAWVGVAIGRVLDLDVKVQRKRILQLLNEWLENDVLQVVERLDAIRHPRKFVEVGTWITE